MFSPDGPYNDKIQVSPLQFVTNWTQSFTMTCLATDVYPVPAYVWDVIHCDNGNAGSTCTFTPHSPTHITRATCLASHEGFGYTVAIKRVQLNFKCEFILSICFLYFDFYHVHDQNRMNCTGKYLCCKVIGYLNVAIVYLSMLFIVHDDNNEDANCALLKSRYKVLVSKVSLAI